MASAKAKQAMLKKLIKEKKEAKEKVDHPLAKYNSRGQLTCILCDATVRSEILWPTHLKSKSHKEVVTSLKSQTNQPTLLPPPPTTTTSTSTTSTKSTSGAILPSKRKQLDKISEREDSSDVAKKSKDNVPQPNPPPPELPSDFFESGIKPPTTVAYSDSESSEEEKPNDSSLKSENGSTADLQATTETEEEEETPTSPNTSSSAKSNLPQGFFDDPKMDAKARKVEYRDPKEDEWEKFQKAMQQETQVSMAMQEEEDEVTNEGRELDDLKDQVTCFARTDDLRSRQEQLLRARQQRQQQTVSPVKKERGGGGPSSDSDSSSLSGSDEDFEELLDWRRKRS